MRRSKTTIEKQASMKNGVSRMAVACLAILLQILLILLLFTKMSEAAVWIDTLIKVLSVILILKIYGQHKTSSMKMPWIILTFVSPVCGMVLYFLIGTDGYSGMMRKRYQEIDAALLPRLPENRTQMERLAAADPDACAVASYIHRNAGYPLWRNTKITYYDDALKGLEAQLRDLAAAERFIFMEYHAIEDAESWHRIRIFQYNASVRRLEGHGNPPGR